MSSRDVRILCAQAKSTVQKIAPPYLMLCEESPILTNLHKPHLNPNKSISLTTNVYQNHLVIVNIM